MNKVTGSFLGVQPLQLLLHSRNSLYKFRSFSINFSTWLVGFPDASKKTTQWRQNAQARASIISVASLHLPTWHVKMVRFVINIKSFTSVFAVSENKIQKEKKNRRRWPIRRTLKLETRRCVSLARLQCSESTSSNVTAWKRDCLGTRIKNSHGKLFWSRSRNLGVPTIYQQCLPTQDAINARSDNFCLVKVYCDAETPQCAIKVFYFLLRTKTGGLVMKTSARLQRCLNGLA